MVHEYDGDIRAWEGWDGKIRNSNREASVGNYFFIVEIKGWDDVNYNNNNWGSNEPQSENTGNEGEDSGGNSGSSFGIIRLYR